MKEKNKNVDMGGGARKPSSLSLTKVPPAEDVDEFASGFIQVCSGASSGVDSMRTLIMLL